MKSFLYQGLAGSTLVAFAAAQQAPAPAQPPTPRTYQFEAQRMTGSERADFSQQCLLGGFRLRIPSLQLEVRGTNALLLLDVETARARHLELLARRKLGLEEDRVERLVGEQQVVRGHGRSLVATRGPFVARAPGMK